MASVAALSKLISLLFAGMFTIALVLVVVFGLGILISKFMRGEKKQ